MHEVIVQWQIDKNLYNFQNMQSREWNFIVEFDITTLDSILTIPYL